MGFCKSRVPPNPHVSSIILLPYSLLNGDLGEGEVPDAAQAARSKAFACRKSRAAMVISEVLQLKFWQRLAAVVSDITVLE